MVKWKGKRTQIISDDLKIISDDLIPDLLKL